MSWSTFGAATAWPTEWRAWCVRSTGSIRSCGYRGDALDSKPSAHVTTQYCGARPEFEVASVKPRGQSKGPYMLGGAFQPGGRVSVTNAPLFSLIRWAYDLGFKQLDENGHALLGESFDIDARASANSFPPDMPV